MKHRSTSGELYPLNFRQKLLVHTGILIWAAYLVYRALYTMNWEHPVYSVAFLVAEIIGFASLARFAFTTYRLNKRESLPLKSKPTVDVLIATYNEEPEILLQTIYHVLRMDYPHETYVLDDGRRPEIEKLARELGAHYIARPDNQHAKAGNLNYALSRTRGEIVAVLDADGVPRKDFLTKLLGYFEDREVALVQVPQTFYNVDSFQHLPHRADRQIWHEQSLFFDIIEPGMDHHQAAMCCGSGSLVRRSSLEKIGGFTVGTVTEDLHTTFRLHIEGFKSIYHPEPLAYCLAPNSALAYVVQRARWALGTIQMLRMEWRKILGSSRLTFAQRILYFTPVYYVTAYQKALYYLAPFLFLATDISPFNASTWFIIPLLINIIATLTAYRVLARGRSEIFMTEVFFLYTLWSYLKAVPLGILPVNWRFRVTPKGAGGRASMQLLFIPLIVAILSGTAFAAAIRQYLVQGYSVELWAASSFAWMNLVVALAAIATVRKAAVRSDAYAFFDFRPVRIREVDGTPLMEQDVGIATVISEKGLGFVHAREFKPGTLLSIEISLPDASFTVNAEVTASHARIVNGQDPFFATDLSFVRPDEKARMELIRYFFEDATPRYFVSTRHHRPKDRRHEERRHRRLASMIPVYVGKDKSAPTLGLLVDLSEQGARLKIPTSLEVGSFVQVQIPWIKGSVSAKVVRCIRENGQLNPPYDIGVEFQSAVALSKHQLKSIQALKTAAEELPLAA